MKRAHIVMSGAIALVAALLLGSCHGKVSGSAETALPSNANLASLVLSQGALAPSFRADVLSYTASVASDVGSITVTPTAANPEASITVNSNPVTSETASAPIDLVLGANTITVVVTSADSANQMTYTISVTRAHGEYNALRATRVSGVAPLAVHFLASPPASNETARPFHENHYQWDFGDPTSGNWSTDGKSKNTATGAVAAHVFETAGTFTVTLDVTSPAGEILHQTVDIEVSDADTFYTGTTICVSTGDDFTGAPAGCQQIKTTDLSEIMQYVADSSRVLFKRGDTWTSTNLSWPDQINHVTIGAFGTGAKPIINIAEGEFLDLSYKEDWRVLDQDLRDATQAYAGGSIGGTMAFRQHLIMRVSTQGFGDSLGWTHWNESTPLVPAEMYIVECVCTNNQEGILYVGAEQLALLGNDLSNAHTTHVLRVWQAYESVISHNLISGSSLDNDAGRHALKLHGPEESQISIPPNPNAGELEKRTSFVVISDNVFGSSGPWPVGMGPKDSASDERLTDVLFERNRVVSQYGESSSTPVQVAVHVNGSYFTVRNNVLDGTGSSNGYTGIDVRARYEAVHVHHIDIYNNTIFRADNDSGNSRYGIVIESTANTTRVKNNLVSFPNAAVPTQLLANDSSDLVEEGNLLLDSVSFVDADNATPLSRDFHVTGGEADNGGVDVQVYEDFTGAARADLNDVGAFGI